MARTMEEVTAALASVRTAITAAEASQEYTSGLGNKKVMAALEVLYAREERLIKERTNIQTGGASAGPVRNMGVIRR